MTTTQFPDPTYEPVDDAPPPEMVIEATNMPRLDYAFPEAPASMNFFAITKMGWNIQFTLRDIDEKNMMARFAQFTRYLESVEVTPKQVGQNAKQPTPHASQSTTKRCELHNVDMPQRTSKKTGKVFYSHHVDDEDRWCYGE